MSLPAFDTLKYTKSLEESGIDRKHAEAFAHAQMESLSELMQEKLATKQDLRSVKEELSDVKSELKEDIRSVREEIRSVRDELKEELKDVIKTLRSEMRWLFGITITVLTFIMATFKFFH